MPITTPTQTNHLYRIEYGSNTALFTDIAENQSFDGETYRFIQVSHASPTYSADPQEAEIDLLIYENNPIANLFTLGPPPFPIKLHVYEYDRITETATPRYRGWIVRPSYRLRESIIGFRCKTVWHYYDRESLTDSLAALSRYSIYDPRAGVDVEQFRIGITIDTLNDQRDVLTVTGITELDGHFTGGIIVAPDRDMRTILQHVGDELTLSAAFPRFTLDTGFTADIYPGDDLKYETWANKFAAATNNGEKHGGWPYMPNVDVEKRGVI